MAGSMWRLNQNVSLLNIHSGIWNIALRGISQKKIINDIGLPELPKKPKNVFQQFVDKVRPEICKARPRADFAEVMKIAADRWKEVDAREKNQLKAKYVEGTKKYHENLSRYMESLTPEQKLEVENLQLEILRKKDQKMVKLIKTQNHKDMNKPKRPAPPFMKFLRTMKLEGPDYFKRGSDLWKKATSQEKENLKEEYRKELKEYLEKLDEWENQMIEKGYTEGVRAKTLLKK